MTNEEQKGRIELAIFENFIQAARLAVEPGSTEKMLGNGMPDIQCRINGKTVYFELTESCSPEFAEARSKNSSDQYSDEQWGHDEIDKVVNNKLNKNYQVEEAIELLIYTDGMNTLSDKDIMTKVEPCLRNGLGPFRKIWFYNGKAASVLASTA